MNTFHDALELPPNVRDRLGVPSWRWVVMWAVLVGIILAGMFGILPRPTKENFLVCGIAVAVGVALAVYCLSWTHALLPHEHETICKTTEDTEVHYLAYVTQDEKEAMHRARGRGTASKGLMGTQGVPCFPHDPGIDPMREGSEFVGQVQFRKKRKPPGWTGLLPAYGVWFPPEYATLYLDENGKRYYEDAQGVRRYALTAAAGIDAVYDVRRDIYKDGSRWYYNAKKLDFNTSSSEDSSSESSEDSSEED